ncbi:MAG: phenylalanine--tRNA ligase subunit alpha, partial [Deltaproteobacteria bacterium]|nr:phenylalanine--tRNA ligase subunit alpha [Deltaproteobacteria bacterium]
MESIEQIEKQAIDELGTVKDTESINDLRVHYLGRKGVLTGIMRNISQMPKEERPSAGKKANQVKGIL